MTFIKPTEFTPEVELDWDPNEADSMEISHLNRLNAMAVFKKFGILKISVNFSGEGDSGSIDDIAVDGIAGDIGKIEIPADILLLQTHDEYRMIDGKITPTGKGEPIVAKNLTDFIEEFADLVLQQLPFDWYNNDGGRGTIIIKPREEDNGTIFVHYQQRETITQYEDHLLNA